MRLQTSWRQGPSSVNQNCGICPAEACPPRGLQPSTVPKTCRLRQSPDYPLLSFVRRTVDFFNVTHFCRSQTQAIDFRVVLYIHFADVSPSLLGDSWILANALACTPSYYSKTSKQIQKYVICLSSGLGAYSGCENWLADFNFTFFLGGDFLIGLQPVFRNAFSNPEKPDCMLKLD